MDMVRVLKIGGLVTSLMFGVNLYASAATLRQLWGAPETQPGLQQFYFDHQFIKNQPSLKNTYLYAAANQHSTNGGDTLKAVATRSLSGATHTRYRQFWHGLPVWGAQVIVHHKNHTKITGLLVSDIEKDVPSSRPQLDPAAVREIVQTDLRTRYPGHRLSSWRGVKTKLMVMLTPQSRSVAVQGAMVTPQPDTQTARLVYHLTFFVRDKNSRELHRPVYLIDANSGELIEQYDNLPTAAAGVGPGGNDIAGLAFRATNHYQFGNAINGLPAFSAMPVRVAGSTCTMTTAQTRLSSFLNQPGSDGEDDDNGAEPDFPIPYVEEVNYPAFSYPCNENATDAGFSPILADGYQSYSPSNDAFYFANMTYTMMQELIPEVANPWGTLLPIRIYTHVSYLDNAFALSPRDDTDEPLSTDPTLTESHSEEEFNPQFVVGNGDTLFYALSDASTVGHELSHLFTAYHSNLIYTNQSGGINEAYSDIAGQTLMYYLSQQYPWYGFTWDIGADICLPSGRFAGKALRYFANPPQDGRSIANAADFKHGMNPHRASGVFNYAFYLMVTKYHIPMYTAYRYMSLANAAYWIPSSNYNDASCGVLQAAYDTGNRGDFDKLTAAFNDVGVKCKVGFSQLTAAL